MPDSPAEPAPTARLAEALAKEVEERVESCLDATGIRFVERLTAYGYAKVAEADCRRSDARRNAANKKVREAVSAIIQERRDFARALLSQLAALEAEREKMADRLRWAVRRGLYCAGVEILPRGDGTNTEASDRFDYFDDLGDAHEFPGPRYDSTNGADKDAAMIAGIDMVMIGERIANEASGKSPESDATRAAVRRAREQEEAK